MPFGFGFNKAKVLASAEKNVKSGKLQNAIADYEKIAKEDPKDLNVLNTIGDLYARVGNPEQACAYFKRVADAFAGDGFTVKAIAMYKKITKLNSSAIDAVSRLAELYVQQGLYNDARAHYLQIAEHHQRKGELDRAAGIIQKVLDLDPENSTIQTKLAELYASVGKKTEARDIYFRNAELCRSRQQYKAADDALHHVLQIDPAFRQGVLLRGFVKLELGDAAGAIECLEQIPDIDSRPEGLRTLLKARLKLNQLEDAQPLALKLLNVFHDCQGVSAYAEALLAAGDCEGGVRCYSEHADALLAANTPAVVAALESSISRVKESVPALELIASIFQRAGQATHLAEVTELLAHAYVQSGALEKARDLYRDLAAMEPENPLHTQNYRQVLARLGEDPSARALTPEQANKPMLVEELETSAPELPQEYSPEIAAAVRAAITDAELFDSYNLPLKAITPLEAVLQRAPLDPQVNQRLASLYARTSRLSDAGARCRVLQDIYRAAGFVDQAAEYGELAARYLQRAGAAEPTPSALPESDSAAIALDAPGASVQETITLAPPALGFAQPTSSQPEESSVAEFSFAEFNSPAEATDAQSLVEPAATFDFAASSADSAAAIETVWSEIPASGVAAPVAPTSPEAARAPSVAEFDLSSEWESVAENQATDAEPALEPVSPDTDAAICEMLGTAPETVSPGLADLVEEIRFYISQSMWEEATAALDKLTPQAPSAAADLRKDLEARRTSAPAVAQESPEIELVSAPEEETAPANTAGQSSDAETSRVISEPEPLLATEPASEPLSDLVLDLDNALAQQFADPVLAAEALPMPASGPPTPIAPTPSPLARAAAATATGPAAPPQTPPAAQPPASEPGMLTLDDDVAGGALADIFAEFKQDMESGIDNAEDPETHYNLGVAFKEMGLLDEAIGELQKVCQAIDHGHAFPQVLQAYTWLADCFVQKGVPEAAIRWYEKALRHPNADTQIATAIHYELASAFEAAGDRASALAHFMEVYGANIDYRDVAERIKALKS